jgi:hypothetical protein
VPDIAQSGLGNPVLFAFTPVTYQSLLVAYLLLAS